MEGLHPEAVEMEGAQRDTPVQHPVDKAHHRRLIVIGRKRGGQPKPKSPGRRKGRLAGKVGVSCEHILHGGAVEEEVIKTAALHAEGSLGHILRAEFHGDALGMIDKYAVPFIGKEEGDVLVSLFRAGAAVLVVDFHALPVFNKRGEAFAGAVEQFAHVYPQLFPHIGIFQVAVHFVEIALVSGFHQGKVTSAAFGQYFAAAFVGHGPGVLRDDK